MPPKPKPGPAPYNQAASTTCSPEQLFEHLTNLQVQLQEATSSLKSSAQFMDIIKQENVQLRSELAQVKVVVNRQAAYLAQIDSEIDNLAQYGRRENIVFSNLAVGDEQDVKSQIVNLCKEIDVEVHDTDFVDAHVLPGKTGAPKRYIARFHDRSKVKKIFKNRRKTKDVPANRKSELAINDSKGFGIQANITPKRAKLLAQVKEFSTSRNMGNWVDYNSGNILLRIKEGERGTLIRNTRNLVDIDSTYEPVEWYFCSSPFFELSELEFDNHMSPAPQFNPGAHAYDPYSYDNRRFEQGPDPYVNANKRSSRKGYTPY